MLLTCPCCGATCSAEAWQNDAAARDVLAALLKLPRELHPVALPYLGLFRPEKRALTWPRAKRLLDMLAAHIAKREISWDRKPPRPCTPRLWAEGMRQMTERKTGTTARFTNHNYLIALVYDLADKADAHEERSNAGKPKTRADEDERGMSEASRQLVEDTARKLGIK